MSNETMGKRKKKPLPSLDKKGNAVTTGYVQTQEEREEEEAFFVTKRKKVPAPRIKVRKKGKVLETSVDHPEPVVGYALLLKALATTDMDFYSGLISQLLNAGTQGQDVDGKGPNFMLSVIKGVEPTDQLETMLAAQMAAVHMAMMTFARRLAHVENIPQQDSAERAFNKLARTFTAQMEALTRYRGKGQQKMTVEHVHVHQGGQAIVGNVNQEGGGVKNEK